MHFSSQNFSPNSNSNLHNAVHLFFNYWEYKPQQFESKLQELVRADIGAVAVFVPWAQVETDIHHLLKRFLKSAYAARIKVRLFVMPELGVSYPNAGVPKDVLLRTNQLATDRLGQVIYNHVAPNIFAMPSFASTEVLKRFGSFLIKVGSILAEVFHEVSTHDFCEVVVSNSFFNYYRNHGLKWMEHGDYSAVQVMAFRDFLEREYPTNANTADVEHFKMQLYETYNRHRFSSHVESLLREKTEMVFNRKHSSVRVEHCDVSNPECDPASTYNNILTEVLNLKPSLPRFYASIVESAYRDEKIFLSSGGVFRRFSDQEKNFLMLAALVHSGSLLIVHEDFLRTSLLFQRKLQSVVQFLGANGMHKQREVAYIAASKFAMEEKAFTTLTALAPDVVTVSTFQQAMRDVLGAARLKGERLVFIDPKTIVRTQELHQALQWAQQGKVVALPAPLTTSVANYPKEVQVALQKFKKQKTALKLNLGTSYEVIDHELGQLVIYDPQIFWSSLDKTDHEMHGIRQFIQALLGLAEVKPVCSVSDPRVQVVSFLQESNAQSRVLFLMNPHPLEIDAKLSFHNTVALASLPSAGSSGMTPVLGTTFDVKVPALGVLSVQMAEPSQSEIGVEERATRIRQREVTQWT